MSPKCFKGRFKALFGKDPVAKFLSMKKIPWLTFDDVVFQPGKYDWTEDISGYLGPTKIGVPIILSVKDPMKDPLVPALTRHGGVMATPLNSDVKFWSSKIRESQTPTVVTIDRLYLYGEIDFDVDFDELREWGIEWVDIAVPLNSHSHDVMVQSFVTQLKAAGFKVIVGGVSTYDGANYVMDAGADILKVQPLNIPFYRVPDVTALLNVIQARNRYGKDVQVFAGHQFRCITDMVKAMGLGADGLCVDSQFFWYDSKRSLDELIKVFNEFLAHIGDFDVDSILFRKDLT